MTTKRLSLPYGPDVLLPYQAVLDATEPGDVFYLVSDPGTIWYRGDTGMEQEFCYPGNDTWFTRSIFGTGNLKVVVVHNTRTSFAEGVAVGER